MSGRRLRPFAGGAGAPLWLRGDGPRLPEGGARRRRCLEVATTVETLLLLPFSSHSHSEKRERESERGVGLFSDLFIFHFLNLENLHARERERERVE